MRYIFTFLTLFLFFNCSAQKYVLLDKTMAQPAFFSNKITISEKYKDFFPVEKKELHKFIKALEQIYKRLSENKISGKAIDYHVGCTEFTGKAFPLAVGERLDYVLTSTCDNMKVTMHLVDAKFDNADNAYFLKAWIKYIKTEIKK